MAGGFGLVATWLAFRYGMWTWHFASRLPWALFGALAGAGIGKGCGIARARARLNQEIHKLIASKKTHPREV